MFSNEEWVLLDTETTGFKKPIFVVEIGAQKMKGFKRTGPPFIHKLNHSVNIPKEASRVHGYTREILERDGENPSEVYDKFREYAGVLPLVAYNLPYDLTKVLIPEWERLGIEQIGSHGFCALELAKRLLDPVPAGNCKLQTLRQYYRFPERGAHTAMGDVETVIDLLENVLKPIAESRGLTSLDKIKKFCEEKWFPTRFTFGKYKGLDFKTALTDPDVFSWIEWLSRASNKRSSDMGLWYLEQLKLIKNQESDEKNKEPRKSSGDFTPFYNSDDSEKEIVEEVDEIKKLDTGTNLAIYSDEDRKQIKKLIEFARKRLAALLSTYANEKNSVDVITAKLFNLLRDLYQKRDKLKLIILHRNRYLEALLDSGEDAVEEVEADFQEDLGDQEKEYEKTKAETEKVKDLSESEKKELNTIFKKLVKMFHPDTYAGDPDKQTIYEKLIAEVNHARDNSDIELLREIADNPDEFIKSKGWDDIDLASAELEQERSKLRTLYESLNIQIIDVLESLNTLRNNSQYKIWKLSQSSKDYLDDYVKKQREILESEIKTLAEEASRLKDEIFELTGSEETKIF